MCGAAGFGGAQQLLRCRPSLGCGAASAGDQRGGVSHTEGAIRITNNIVIIIVIINKSCLATAWLRRR
jgi:hypothetical protein